MLSGPERTELDAELRRAHDALRAGNPGKARVCARRACGVALRAWRRTNDRPAAAADAQSLLVAASTDEAIPPAARSAAARLSAPVAGDPALVSIDPIGDARELIDALTTGGSAHDA